MTSDMHYALVYYCGELWLSDEEKAAEYVAASDFLRVIATCAEVRTITRFCFARSQHRV